MKKMNLKTVCDSALKDKLEKRGYFVQHNPTTINNWKYPNKIIEIEDEYDYTYLGETKEFTKEEFEKTIRDFLDVPEDDEIDFCTEYYKLKSYASVGFKLVECREEDEGAVEFWVF
ncbi:hypothetical protein [Cetobacterium sp.]|uniref:hypothetical protein n=1 Tax=Cetobacterium sp. TaxID=2071632 RepID=UPI003EE44F3E